MNKCRLVAAEPAPLTALPAISGSCLAFAIQRVHAFGLASPSSFFTLSLIYPLRKPVNWVCGAKTTSNRMDTPPAFRPTPNPFAINVCPPHEHQDRRAKRMMPLSFSLAPSDGERDGMRGRSTHHHPLLASLNHHRSVLENDHASSPANPASTPSTSHAFGHRATPSFDPETSLKRLETTLKWLEMRLKRLEINVENLETFQGFKNFNIVLSTTCENRTLETRENFSVIHEKHPRFGLGSAPFGVPPIGSPIEIQRDEPPIIGGRLCLRRTMRSPSLSPPLPRQRRFGMVHSTRIYESAAAV